MNDDFTIVIFIGDRAFFAFDWPSTPARWFVAKAGRFGRAIMAILGDDSTRLLAVVIGLVMVMQLSGNAVVVDGMVDSSTTTGRDDSRYNRDASQDLLSSCFDVMHGSFHQKTNRVFGCTIETAFAYSIWLGLRPSDQHMMLRYRCCWGCRRLPVPCPTIESPCQCQEGRSP